MKRLAISGRNLNALEIRAAVLTAQAADGFYALLNTDTGFDAWFYGADGSTTFLGSNWTLAAARKRCELRAARPYPL